MRLRRELLNSENIGLAWSFHVSPNSCDNSDYYEQYVKFCAGSDTTTGVALTHLFIDEENNKLAGYVALRTTSLITRNEDGKPVVHPALEVAELAVDSDYERSGVGREMVNFTVAMADLLRHDLLAIKYIAVVADPKAVGFYEKLGFAPVRDVYEIPRDGWNDNCEPMYIRLPDL